MDEAGEYELLDRDERMTSPLGRPVSTSGVNDDFQERKGRSLSYDNTKLRGRDPSETKWELLQGQTWSAPKKTCITKKQAFAMLLLIVGGIAPFVIGANYKYRNINTYTPFEGVFSEKLLLCGRALGMPQNSTVRGIEAWFFLDAKFGRFTFSQAKMIDVAWDIVVGRGIQFIAWWVSYAVFSDALIRVIERHPASYRTFTDICLDGPCLGSGWTLLKNLFYIRSKRTWALYFYMLLSTLWVLGLPVFLSAMTGYDSTATAWTSIGSNSQLVPVSLLAPGIVVYGTQNETWETPTCSAAQQFRDLGLEAEDRKENCDCMQSNGTLVPHRDLERWSSNNPYYPDPWSDCDIHYPGNKQTYVSSIFSPGKVLNCNETGGQVTISNQIYNTSTLDSRGGYCFEDRGLEAGEIRDATRCLPDTQNPTYQWGFSTMLLGLFCILQFTWSLTMYAVWQDAQRSSELVKSGYAMTRLRAAFTLTVVASKRTQLEEKELIRADKSNLEEELFGRRKLEGAEINYDIFKTNSRIDI